VEKVIISMKDDFSLAPGPRYIKEGAHSGEEFRNNVLEPKYEYALKENGIVSIDLDGTFGYGTSFLEEVFGGLARKYANINVMDHLEIISEEEPYLINDIKKYITEASIGK
jgi:hypothetical protein